ncbi:MAG: ORF6N domain-containing protein [Acidovorax sp.]|uniref:ORF6N domain-containing protein n=1 Tax=Acidovorax sp. TaxID=1872122 RepID=UPI0039E70A54
MTNTIGTDDLAASAVQSIGLAIVTLRGQRVIMDSDLAALYGIPTKRFNEAVKRNSAKFPEDFMFQLSPEEWVILRSQIATSSLATPQHGGRRYSPRVFTEHGALMAAMILNSPRAVQVSVYVVRAFVRLREAALQHEDLAQRLDALEDKTERLSIGHEQFSRNTRAQLKQVFDALRELMTPPVPPRRPIGFVTPEDKKDDAPDRGKKLSKE